MRWSYSSINQFKTCPATFYRRYVLRDFRESPNTFFGNAVHKYAEDYCKGSVDKDKIFKDSKTSTRRKPTFEKAIYNVNFFCDSEIKPFEYKLEQEINHKVGEYNMVFKIDAIAFHPEDPNIIHFYDYKTSKTSAFWESYVFQMRLFKFALEKVFPGKDIQPHLFYVLPNDLVPISVSTDGTEEELNNMINEIVSKEDEFFETVNQFCNWCDYKDVCKTISKE